MNREILFRGKRTEDGKWMYGYYQDEKTSTADFPCIVPFCGSAYDDDNDWEVDVETVGQYTDLTDKNGKKIFEGDVLEGDLNDDLDPGAKWRSEVVWGKFGWMCKERQILPMDEFDIREGEIIGNIYDNPELMEDYKNNE